MIVTAPQLIAVSLGSPGRENVDSIVNALATYGEIVGLNRPHRVAHYIAQLAEESGGFHYDHELWGPTAAQKGYDTRTDLGNTAAVDGDGYLYRGRAGIQITGLANYRAFRDWAMVQGLKPPNFVINPDAVTTDPWEGLVPIWFWSSRGLNAYADANDITAITRRINGGLNGLTERLNYYTRIGLVLLGYAPNDIRGFQRTAQIAVDGIAGPGTRAAIHAALLKLPAAPADAQPSPPAPIPPSPDIPAPEPEPAPVEPALGWWARLWKALFG